MRKNTSKQKKTKNKKKIKKKTPQNKQTNKKTKQNKKYKKKNKKQKKTAQKNTQTNFWNFAIIKVVRERFRSFHTTVCAFRLAFAATGDLQSRKYGIEKY